MKVLCAHCKAPVEVADTWEKFRCPSCDGITSRPVASVGGLAPHREAFSLDEPRRNKAAEDARARNMGCCMMLAVACLAIAVIEAFLDGGRTSFAIVAAIAARMFQAMAYEQK